MSFRKCKISVYSAARELTARLPEARNLDAVQVQEHEYGRVPRRMSNPRAGSLRDRGIDWEGRGRNL